MLRLNVLILASVYAALFLALRAARLRWTRPALYISLAVAPWIALLAVVAARGVWWTQRPASVRLFALALALHWTLTLTRRAGRAGSDVTALRTMAIAIGALAIPGAAFGLNAFGCGVSMGLGAVAALLASIAAHGSRSTALGFLTVVVTTMLGLAVGEGAVRLLEIGGRVEEVDRRDQARQFYSLTPPGSAFINRPKPLDEFAPALIEINSLGMRGPELSQRAADVLLIGDSFVEARQLPWERAIGARLQDAVRVRRLPLQVVSHGMRGWSTLLEWNWYIKAGRQLHPRDVFLFFFWNDLWTSGTEQATFRAVMTPSGRPGYFDVPVDHWAIWYKHSRLVRVTEAVWQQAGLRDLKRAFAGVGAGTLSSAVLDLAAAQNLARTLAPGPAWTPAEVAALLTQPLEALPPGLRAAAEADFWPGLRPREVWTDAQQRAATIAAEELNRFAEDVSADGGRLTVVYVPNPYQVHPSECAVGRLLERLGPDTVLPPTSGIQRWLEDAARSAGITFLDPTTDMRAFDQAQPAEAFVPLYLRADCHWSPRGHQFVADYLGDFLARR